MSPRSDSQKPRTEQQPCTRFAAAMLAVSALAGCTTTEQTPPTYLYLGRVLQEDPSTKIATVMLCTLSTYRSEKPTLGYIVDTANPNGVPDESFSPHRVPLEPNSKEKPHRLMWRQLLAETSVDWGSQYVGFSHDVTTAPSDVAAIANSVPKDCIAQIPDPLQNFSRPGTFAFVFHNKDGVETLQPAPHLEGFRYVYS